MPTSTSEPARTQIRARALGLGFDAVGFGRPEAARAAGAQLAEFVRRGLHGDMGWMATTLARRRDPEALWPAARSAVMVGLNYGPDSDPLASVGRADRGTISVYARNRDYHGVVKGRLKQLAGWMATHFAADVKVFVDTAPLLEKPLAHAAGLGWQGKHTNLLSRAYGSWLFLGAVLTTLDLDADAAESDHCGSCRRCLDACPTEAFPAPYRIDARRCISYLTIEHKGHIPRDLRAAMGNRIYGCDDCLAVCPWNKFARATAEAKLTARADLAAPRLADLAALDDAAFRRRFAGSPIKRIGRDRFLRNVLIALGNSGEPALAAAAEPHLSADSALVRAAAIWALSRLLPRERFAALRARHLPGEPDAEVRAEWQAND
jgi:epoxyqueuosine reductase